MKKIFSPNNNKSFRKVSDEKCKTFYEVSRIRNDENLLLVEKNPDSNKKETTRNFEILLTKSKNAFPKPWIRIRRGTFDGWHNKLSKVFFFFQWSRMKNPQHIREDHGLISKFSKKLNELVERQTFSEINLNVEKV